MSANVKGISEIVEPYDEPAMAFEVTTPIFASAPCVYRYYRNTSATRLARGGHAPRGDALT